MNVTVHESWGPRSHLNFQRVQKFGGKDRKIPANYIVYWTLNYVQIYLSCWFKWGMYMTILLSLDWVLHTAFSTTCIDRCHHKTERCFWPAFVSYKLRFELLFQWNINKLCQVCKQMWRIYELTYVECKKDHECPINHSHYKQLYWWGCFKKQ